MPDSNCRNCGAPIKGNRCEYCGTEYPDERESYIHMTANSIRVGVVVADRLEKIRRMERCAAYE